MSCSSLVKVMRDTNWTDFPLELWPVKLIQDTTTTTQSVRINDNHKANSNFIYHCQYSLCWNRVKTKRKKEKKQITSHFITKHMLDPVRFFQLHHIDWIYC